jgi:hypothetical protein
MKWYNYLACFLAGVSLIHILPHMLNGLSLKNFLGVVVSAALGALLLWAGKFSFRDPWAVFLVLAGMAAVLVFTVLHPHHDHATNHLPDHATMSECSTPESSLRRAYLSASAADTNPLTTQTATPSL